MRKVENTGLHIKSETKKEAWNAELVFWFEAEAKRKTVALSITQAVSVFISMENRFNEKT